jgi:hypothetical protein
LWHEGIRLVQDQMPRLPVSVVESLSKFRHEPRLLAFPERRQIEPHREAFVHHDVGDELAGADLEGHIAVQ